MLCSRFTFRFSSLVSSSASFLVFFSMSATLAADVTNVWEGKQADLQAGAVPIFAILAILLIVSFGIGISRFLSSRASGSDSDDD
jgi:hypothetical protein